GASLVTALRPIGLTQSSPSSEMKYDQTRNHGLTRMPAPLCAMEPAGINTANERPMNRSPSANLAGTDGSLRPSRSHSHPKNGESRMTKMGCTDGNHDEGKWTPNMSSRV